MNISTAERKRIEDFKLLAKQDPERAKRTLDEQISLQRKGSASAIEHIKGKKYDTVTASMIVNSWASGFFAGYRFYQRHRGADTRTWRQRVAIWDRNAWHPFTLPDHSRAMARQYVNQNFHSLSSQMVALVTSAAEQGFAKGYEAAINEFVGN